MDFEGKKIAVIGIAKSGISAGILLCRLGAEVYLYDAKKKSKINSEYFTEMDNYLYHDLMGKDISGIITDFDMLVMSPGVPLDLPFIEKARESGVKIISEIELGFITSKADFIAITGTNGKTTVTDLTGCIFKNAGRNTFVLGNIGVPITQESLNTKQGDYVVAETAALQLDTIDSYHPKVCTILNVTEDHLNRYHTMKNYTAAKARIYENQDKSDFCILNYDNEITRLLASEVPSKVLFFSRRTEVEEGAFVRDGIVCIRIGNKEETVIPAEDIKIPGNHNLENALAAALLAYVSGISADIIADTLRSYAGVEHRIEFVKTVDGVDFINDSKGTNPDATVNAVLAMKKSTVLILGGSTKKNDFKDMFRQFTPNIRYCIFIGETAPDLKRDADSVGFSNYEYVEGFEPAVKRAFDVAEKGETVLLSPACASFDMFENFEQRGEVFKKIVCELR